MPQDNEPPSHFNQVLRRKAEYIKPPNELKAKVGSGGLSDDILQKAQALLEDNAVDFLPLAEMYLNALIRGVEKCQNPTPRDDNESLIASILYPAMQLKANGGMFHYQLVTKISDKLIQYLEVIAEPDEDAIEIVLAFHTTMRAIIISRITGNGGRHGFELMQALDEACNRYFDRSDRVEARDTLTGDYSENF
ncbi:MAG: hypothetical protein KKA05_06630 [Alphaproteobacteria bacterium]|nr:hypothetical protein [Alphaproteobacteria bacterium]